MRKTDANGYLQMPGSRTVRSPLDRRRWYFANTPSVAVPDDTEDLWTWRGRRYLLRGVDAADYRLHMRVRSPKWATVALPGAVFRSLVRPLHDFLRGYEPCAAECPF